MLSLRRRLPPILLQLFTLFWLAALLYPFFWLLMLSLKKPVDAFASPPVLIFRPTFENYVALVADNFLRRFGNSVVVALGTMVFSLLLGVPAAYALARARLKHRSSLMLWILIVRMVPGMAYVIPFFVVYRAIDWLDKPQALIILYSVFNLALVMWTMEAFFSELPLELEESARVDGASIAQTFTRIVLPLSTPGLVACAILCFLFSWNEFMFALIITRGSSMTAPVAVTSFLAYEGADWGKIAAATVVLLIPVLLFSFAVRNYLVRGLLSGAMKG